MNDLTDRTYSFGLVAWLACRGEYDLAADDSNGSDENENSSPLYFSG